MKMGAIGLRSVCVAFATNLLRQFSVLVYQTNQMCGVAQVGSVVGAFLVATALLTCGIAKGHSMTAPHVTAFRLCVP